MFRKNNQHQQPSFFNSNLSMLKKMRQQLHDSWVGVFRTEVFERISEERFARLYRLMPDPMVQATWDNDTPDQQLTWTADHVRYELFTTSSDLTLDDLLVMVNSLQ